MQSNSLQAISMPLKAVNQKTAKSVSFGSHPIYRASEKSLTLLKAKSPKLVKSSFNNFSGVITSFSKPKALTNAVELNADLSAANDIERIRTGINGIIRPPESLSSKDLLKLIDHDLMITTPEDISKILNSFSSEDREIASSAMQRLTQFGNYESFNSLVEEAENFSGKLFFADNSVSFPSILAYLGNKKKNYPNIQFDAFFKTVVLDSEILNRLKTEPKFLSGLKMRSAKFVYPEGWINGMNPFNHTADLKELTKTVVSDAKKIMNENKNISIDDAIGAAMNVSIIKDLKDLGLAGDFKIIQNSQMLKNSPTPQQISKQLMPAKPELEDIDEVLNKLPADYRQLALENLARNIMPYSPKKLAVKMQELHKQICPDGNIDGVYYVVSKVHKSYGIMALQYKMANNIPSSHFITQHDLKTMDKAKKIVILDDVSGSGGNLSDEYFLLRERCDSELVLAPIVAADKAIENFSSYIAKDPKLTFLSDNLVTSLKKTDYFKSLSEQDKLKYMKLVQDTGCQSNGLNMVFPYMSPDNNNLFFASQFAKYFTLNGNGLKNYKDFSFEDLYKPLPTKPEEISELYFS